MSDKKVTVGNPNASVVPITQAPLNRPVRERRVEKQPSVSDRRYYALLSIERNNYVEEHPLVRQNPEPTGHSAIDKLHLVKARIAIEAATLEFNRKELEKRGKDTSQISTRIITSLSKIADIELEIKKLGHTVIDPKSTEVQNILKIWLEAMKETTSELVSEGSMNPQTLDLFFSKFSNKMEGWEDRVENR